MSFVAKYSFMKNVYSLFILLLLASCTSDDGIVEESAIPSKEKVLTGTVNISDFPYTFEINGKEITVGIKNNPQNEDIKSTRAVEKVGPYKIKCPYKKIFENRRIPIQHVPGIAAGIYFCDVFYFMNSVPIPSDAGGVTVLFPDPCGYSDYDTQEIGIKWAWQPGNDFLVVYFYTLRLMYNSAGAMLGWLIPCAGEDVTIEYYYYRMT